jgi:hypothetical protein
MAKKKKQIKSKKGKEEVCETFEVEKKGKEKIETVCNSMDKKHASKEELKHQEKILRNVLIGFALVIVLIFVGYYYIDSLKYFEYEGVSGEVVSEGDLIFYQVSVPYKRVNDQLINYNIYIRNDPRKLDKIPFEGEMDFGRKFSDAQYRLVINSTDIFDCEGDGIIAVANMANLLALKIKTVKDENATCDPDGRYIFADIKKGDETKVVEVGPACYDIYVKDCEILKGTERFMVEAMVKHFRDA